MCASRSRRSVARTLHRITEQRQLRDQKVPVVALDLDQTVPDGAAEAATLKVARVPIPAFDNAAKAGDIFVEELQAAVLGRKEVARAMDDVARRVKPLLPT